jgi:hypothetical protein
LHFFWRVQAMGKPMGWRWAGDAMRWAGDGQADGLAMGKPMGWRWAGDGQADALAMRWRWAGDAMRCDAMGKPMRWRWASRWAKEKARDASRAFVIV